MFGYLYYWFACHYYKKAYKADHPVHFSAAIAVGAIQFSLVYNAYMIYIMFFVLIVFCMYRIFKKSSSFYIISSIFILGTITRFIMSISPTIYASGERTFVFMYIAFIACVVMIIDKIMQTYSKDKPKI